MHCPVISHYHAGFFQQNCGDFTNISSLVMIRISFYNFAMHPGNAFVVRCNVHVTNLQLDHFLQCILLQDEQDEQDEQDKSITFCWLKIFSITLQYINAPVI